MIALFKQYFFKVASLLTNNRCLIIGSELFVRCFKRITALLLYSMGIEEKLNPPQIKSALINFLGKHHDRIH